MPLRLVCLDSHADIALDRAMVVVGRHIRCDVRIDSSRVSRHHCSLALDRDGVLVRDLGSTNGTRINGRRVDRGVLRPGDELSIAHYRYHLRDASPS
jgi:pSer/pThr/pTyr-binding forkhead associated (FHA) protein